MSISEFFDKVRNAVANAASPKADQHDLAIKAMANGSRYPSAHNYGGRHPGWLTKGAH